MSGRPFVSKGVVASEAFSLGNGDTVDYIREGVKYGGGVSYRVIVQTRCLG